MGLFKMRKRRPKAVDGWIIFCKNWDSPGENRFFRLLRDAKDVSCEACDIVPVTLSVRRKVKCK